MDAVLAAAADAGIPDDHLHREYFSVPEQPDYENYAFELLLGKSGRRIRVEADETASDALIANGYAVDVKCSDGLCGVCQCGVVSGDIEHRDFVLSQKQQQRMIILCQSRAADRKTALSKLICDAGVRAASSVGLVVTGVGAVGEIAAMVLALGQIALDCQP